jgi:hypothetical protein
LNGFSTKILRALTVGESHLCAKGAQRWGTQLPWMMRGKRVPHRAFSPIRNDISLLILICGRVFWSQLLYAFDYVEVGEGADVAVDVGFGIWGNGDGANGVDARRVGRD